jgi:hypothetical protein
MSIWACEASANKIGRRGGDFAPGVHSTVIHGSAKDVPQDHVGHAQQLLLGPTSLSPVHHNPFQDRPRLLATTPQQ